MPARLVLATVLTVLALSAAVHTAQADGIATPRPYARYEEPVYQPYDWSGFYLGGHLGGAHVVTNWTANVLEPIDHTSSNFIGGAQLGLQKQWGRTVFGVEVSYDWLNDEQSNASILIPGTTFNSDVSNIFTVVGRLGYAYENMLAYAKGGYASADIALGVTAAGLALQRSERESGWVAGVGIEFACTDNISIGVEYDYMHFNVSGGTVSSIPISDAGTDLQSVMARLNFKFGRRAEVIPYK
jgi:outer membrane immunogenic protein